ncbi:putative tetratricopeptide-like helical domain superfamily [Dioscorea sansibarensis]
MSSSRCLHLSRRALHIVNPSFEAHEVDLVRCLSLHDLLTARRLLADSSHFADDISRQTSLLSRLARFGLIKEARLLFDLMPRRSLITWNAMLSAYSRIPSLLPSARQLFHQMPRRNVISCTAFLSALSHSGLITEALELFHSMPERNIITHNAMVSGLVRSGELEDARKLFDDMPERNSASWNALLSGYAERGRLADARHLFDQMPDHHRDVVSWTALIAGYCRAGDVYEAYDLFSIMTPHRNVVTWTAMIGGFVWNGFYEDAILLFKEMMNRTADVKPNKETILSLIYACAGIGFARLGAQIHGYLTVHCMDGDDHDGRLSKGLIHMYSRYRLMCSARWICNMKRNTCDAVCWQSLIEGYIGIGRLDEARRLFDEIASNLDAISWVTMIVTWTTMITAYFDGGDVSEARQLFDRMPERDATAWAAVISGMVHNEMIPEAFDVFLEMRANGFAVMDHAFASLLGTVGSIACLQIGEQLHALMIKTRPVTDTILCNALVAMYAKCGDVAGARHVFNSLVSRDVISWNSMIMGLAHHGEAHEALIMFDEMVPRGGVEPDGVTFLGVLTACGHSGLVDRGLEVFGSMGSVEPEMGHYASMVDMLGRAGRFEEAVRFVREMPVEPGLAVWGALLGTCGMGSDLGSAGVRRRVGEWAAEKVLEVDPMNGPAHVALCHVYSNEGMRHVAEGEVWQVMVRKGLSKAPGRSWIVLKST